MKTGVKYIVIRLYNLIRLKHSLHPKQMLIRLLVGLFGWTLRYVDRS